MVDAPGVVDYCAKLLDVKNGIAQFCTAPDGIFHFVECAGETIHVIDLLGLVGALHEIAVLVPVG